MELLIFEEKLKEAEKIIASLEKIDPTYDEIYIQKAAIFSKKDLHMDAIEILHKALTYTNDVADVQSLIGMEYLYMENFKDAIIHFEACLHSDEEDFTALYNIIYCFDMDDRHEDAIVFLNNFIDENPYCEIAWHQLGRQYFSLRKNNEAIRAFDYAILIDEYFVGAYFEKAKVLEEQKEYLEAIKNYQLTLKLDDPTAYTYLQIANCYKKLKNSKKAIQYYHKATQEDPMMEKAWLLLTKAYLKEKNNQKALYFIQKALEIDPGNKDYLNLFGEINIKLNLYEEAAKAFNDSILLGENNIEIFLALADVYTYIGHFDEALEAVIHAKELFGEIVEILYRLGGINLSLRKNKEGMYYLERGMEQDFDYFQIIKELFPNAFEKDKVKELIAKFSDEAHD